MSGYASDNGMYMPMEIPKLSEETLKSWANLSYKDIVKEISKLFIEDEIPAEKICELIDAGFETFKDPSSPIVTKTLAEDVKLLEMFHGKTLAFKDLSMCCTAQFINYFLDQSNSSATLLIATSGDTGSSALHAMSSIERVDIIVLLPKDRISQVQERQMTSVVSDNCHVIRADGTSDDTDVPLRKAFLDGELVKKHKLGTLNSVNWSRMMVQIAHHVYAYFEGKRTNPETDTVVFIPTGGLGNATAGCIAREMGLPIQMVCAVTNDALHRAVYNCDYSVTELTVSLASAMNLQVIYNFERILYLLSDMDTSLVKKIQEDYQERNKSTIPETLVNKLKEFMRVTKVTDEDIIETIKRCADENGGYVICPHTASALSAAYSLEALKDHNAVIYAAASPAKFSDALERAGVQWTGRNLAEELAAKEVRYTDWEASDDWLQKLLELLDTIHARRSAHSK
ncbi:threonine synthase-like 2 isoform X2 [Watersipora subatra]